MIAKLMHELGWPEATLHSATVNSCRLGYAPRAYPDIMQDCRFQNWALQLIAGFDDRIDRRQAYTHAVQLYCLGSQDLERTLALLDTPPYGEFSPWKVLVIGNFAEAVRMVRYLLDTADGERVRDAESNNPFLHIKPRRHLLTQTFTVLLHMRPQSDQRLQRIYEHLAECEGCSLNVSLAYAPSR